MKSSDMRKASTMNGRVMMQAVQFVLVVVAMLIPPIYPAIAEEITPFAPFQTFVQRYCASCHDETEPSAGLTLTTLSNRLDDNAVFETWRRVHNKLVTEEMPPRDEPQPSSAERTQVLGSLHRSLHEASLKTQEREGRVVLRRLNRKEYQHTIRDLLGVPINVDMLPEDSITAGFDKVSTGLGTSTEHLVRYQQAADRALAATVPIDPPTPWKQRTTGKELWDRINDYLIKYGNVTRELHYSAKLEGDAIVYYHQTEVRGNLEANFPRIGGDSRYRPGRYRLRASLSAKNSGGNPLPAMFFWMGIPLGVDSTNVRTIAIVDAPPGTPRVVTVEIDITDVLPVAVSGHRAHPLISLKAFTLPDWSSPTLQKHIEAGKPADFSGPGLAVHWIEIEGPLGPLPSLGYERLFGDLPVEPRSYVMARAKGEPVPSGEWRNQPEYVYTNNPIIPSSANPKIDAARLIRTFLPLAFRRPVDDSTVQHFVEVAHQQLDAGTLFADAMRVAYRAILCSSQFLFLIEPPGPLDDYAIASRLSYFLWTSLPDEELLTLAANKELRRSDILHSQVERMLNDEKAGRFIDDFVDQWLDLRHLHMTKPGLHYPEYDNQLLGAMPLETRGFFREVLANDLSVTEFVDSNWTYLNARLARHYGIPGVSSWEIHKVPLPPNCHRGGVMTHAAVLKVTANGTVTSPILRGKWVLDKLIGRPPAPPPPNLPAIEPDIRGATTIRQQLEKHRNVTTCANCHKHIDPPGFALENYDVIGGWREWYRGAYGVGGKEFVELANYPGTKIWKTLDVEQGDVTAEGHVFKDIDEYKQLLLVDKDQLARNLVEKLITYATGAPPQFADREVIEKIVVESRNKNYGLRGLLHAVVQSRIFLNK